MVSLEPARFNFLSETGAANEKNNGIGDRAPSLLGVTVLLLLTRRIGSVIVVYRGESAAGCAGKQAFVS